MWGIFHIIMSVPHNIVMDLNNILILIVCSISYEMSAGMV